MRYETLSLPSFLILFETQNTADKLTQPQQALGHIWLSGKNATDHNLLPEIEAFRRKNRLRRAIEIVKLQNRINKLKEHEDDPENSELGSAAVSSDEDKGARLHALGLFALKDVKQKQETLQMEEEMGKEAKRRSFTES